MKSTLLGCNFGERRRRFLPAFEFHWREWVTSFVFHCWCTVLTAERASLMKPTRRSMILFLGTLVAGSVAAYMASRHSVFAAGGGNDCPPCTYCIFPYAYWGTGTVTVYGQVNDGTKAPEQSALVGSSINQDQNMTIYSGQICESFQIQGIDLLDAVTYDSCTPDCNMTKYPPPPGYYTGTNPQGASPPGKTFTQSWCNSD